MKKMFFVAAFGLLGFTSSAQFSQDFESYGLAPETYDNDGTTGLSYFDFPYLVLNNFYDTAWGGYWEGFSISNITDNTTAGIMNQYSSFTGSGANGSSTYAVAYSTPEINAYAGIIDSFRIANSTYAALSMRDGDAFGKQFGSIYNANGNIDSTNGEDFFKVWIIAKDAWSAQEDSVEFYLADYRFADSALDYIFDGWTTINVSNFGFYTGSVRFRFESSDMSWGYINTPTYFVLDDIFYWPVEGLDEMNTMKISTYPNPMTNQLTVSGEAGELSVYDIQGNLIYTDEHQGASYVDVSAWASGSYFVQVVNERGIAHQKVTK